MTIQIEGLELYAYHGYFQEERKLGQRFIFDVEVELGSGVSFRDDDLALSVRYDFLIDTIENITANRTFQTLETFGEALATSLLENFPAILRIRLGIGKLHPPIRQRVKKVGITLDVRRPTIAAIADAAESS